MKKGEDEAEEFTESDCEREEKESRKRSSSPEVADELPSDVTEMELHRMCFNILHAWWELMLYAVAQDVAAFAGRKNIKRKDIEVLRTYAAMLGRSSL